MRTADNGPFVTLSDHVAWEVLICCLNFQVLAVERLYKLQPFKEVKNCLTENKDHLAWLESVAPEYDVPNLWSCDKLLSEY
jgi:hypothetical protein